ncbi:hypothetical protein ACQCLI_32685 (plasmid) [Pseudomonas nitroreducens]|uniref:hypothetical protein n=1 Tax=Pseudomonas nitroreducens TaxID=46680 RepID=UPI003D08F923
MSKAKIFFTGVVNGLPGVKVLEVEVFLKESVINRKFQIAKKFVEWLVRSFWHSPSQDGTVSLELIVGERVFLFGEEQVLWGAEETIHE